MSPFWMGMLRRFVLAPAIIALTVVLLLAAPLWLVLAVLLSPLVKGRLRILRLLSIAMLHLIMETVLLVVMFVLWVASGFGWKLRTPAFQRAHYALVRWYLVVFFREARRVLNLEITTEGPTPDAFPGHPLLVCSRHAGPGDSFTLMYALMVWYQREPRVVLKDTMGWDPAIGTVLNRLPARFISPNPRAGSSTGDEIAQLAENLDENDAFVIFPEGGNFTPARKERAVARLRKVGMDRMADRAERMDNVLAPRPGGFLAALDAAPEADVLLVAHTGLDHLAALGDLWREVPMDKQLIMRFWRVSRDEIPEGREARIDWLFTRWEEIDAWVTENRPVEVDPWSKRRKRASA